MKKNIFSFFLGFTLILGFTSSQCGMKSDDAPTQSRGLPLSSQWILESFYEQSIIEISKTTYVSISEDFKTYEGNGGCNTFSGLLKVDGNKINFKQGMITKIACDILPQEQLFLEKLSASDNYFIEGGELRLYKGKELLMVLESWR